MDKTHSEHNESAFGPIATKQRRNRRDDGTEL